LTRRVSIVAGAHRKKSHADGSSLFQWLSTAVRRSNFNPPNAAGRNEEHGKNRLVVTRDITPRKGRAPQRIRLRTFVTISSGVPARGNVNWQGQRFGFRGADAKQNCRAIGAGPRSRRGRRSASTSCRNVWRDGLHGKTCPAWPRLCKTRWRVSRVVRRRSTCRKRAQWRRSTRRFWRIVVSARPRSLWPCAISRVNATNKPPGDRIGVPPARAPSAWRW